MRRKVIAGAVGVTGLTLAVLYGPALATSASELREGLPIDALAQTVWIEEFDVSPDGTLSNNRVFADMSSAEPGVPDGMKVDTEGRVFCTGSGGIWVFDPAGNRLGVIRGPEVPGGTDIELVHTQLASDESAQRLRATYQQEQTCIVSSATGHGLDDLRRAFGSLVA